MLGLIFITLFSLAAAAPPRCSREFLERATELYTDAQADGDSSSVVTLSASNLTYTENERPMKITDGILSKPLDIDFDRSIHDTVQCATFTELIAATDPHPYVIHTRMVFSPTLHRATLIESIVTDDGDWLFNATGTLEINDDEDWDYISSDDQDDRGTIKSLGDAYFDRFSDESVAVPWGAPCYRLEGGLKASGTMEGEDCIMVWPRSITVPYRRYVVDKEQGAVSLFTGFPGLDRSQGEDAMPDSHFFRVEGGKIRYIHTASSCVEKGCGL